MVENSKVKRKSGRKNPAGLLSFMSLSGKESSKETVASIFDNTEKSGEATEGSIGFCFTANIASRLI